jgi:cytochrome c oxidase subunit 2
VISPEAPHSPNAEDMTVLYWIGLVAVVGLIAAVNLGLVALARRYRAERGREPKRAEAGRGLQLRAGLALGLLALVLLVTSVVFTESARKAEPTGSGGLQASEATFAQRSLSLPSEEASAPVEITATGQQWIWRYEYPNGAFSYYELVVPVDTTVVLDLVSTDVVHTWFVPELAGKFDAVPGKLNKVWFRADETGTYEGRSATFSGAGYAAMGISVRVVTPEEYESHIEELAREIDEAQQAAAEEISGGGAS